MPTLPDTTMPVTDRATTPLWIDTDMGVDDLLAILLVRATDRRVDGCSISFGNASLARVSTNAAGFAHAFGWDFPIHVGAAGPLAGRDPVTAANVLGASGLPTRGLRPDEAGALPERAGAVDALLGWLGSTDVPGEVLALGPLTNLAWAARTDPARFAKLARITWMGGGASRGNHTPHAEFNAFADPEALAAVAASGVPLRIVDLDLCRRVHVDDADLSPLAGHCTPQARLLTDLFGGYVDIALSRGRPAMALYDPVAAVAIVADDALRFDDVSMRVDTSDGPARGCTRFADAADAADAGVVAGDVAGVPDAGERASNFTDTTLPRVSLARDVDIDAVRALLHAALRHGATGETE